MRLWARKYDDLSMISKNTAKFKLVFTRFCFNRDCPKDVDRWFNEWYIVGLQSKTKMPYIMDSNKNRMAD